ncbi:hypothetical protein QFW96_27220 [Saccharopolyspora sp. TS4A08]|uniref:Uncharacterized protein n=1 Tax=Saccharopolyspora ipomoeae TaxID=3042027 RepID=A0ABT6PWW1_9PSEU|nr:hypothetical protein [Saccharopolyspora sp. TS4A08]MDI2032340.1 hypothetical protein [Saccharopolyspora sp. TS4A08]
MTGRNTEDALSAALRARAVGRSGPPQRNRRPGPGGVLLFVIVLGLLAGLLAAGVTVLYPIG